MNSKTKGNIGEGVVLSEFVKRGIQVSIPFGDNARYDLIAEFNGKLNKIQVKYCNEINEAGSIICNCISSTNHTTNKHYTTYENDIDYFAFYLVPLDHTILVPIENIGTKKRLAVRIEKSKNNRADKAAYIDDYSIDKILHINP
jgi:hypothetical protein